jgi:hypothetical protein
MPEPVDIIRLSIPGTPDFLRVARLMAADVGSRAGFTYEEVEDLRIAVDELCFALTGHDGIESLTLIFLLADGAVTVEGEGSPSAAHGEQSELSKNIVAAVADEHELRIADDAASFRLVKRATADR